MLIKKRSTRKSLEERRDERVQVRNPYEGLIFIISIIDILYEQTNLLMLKLLVLFSINLQMV